MAAIVHSGKRVLSRYATFSGRASRPEYWWWVLLMLLIQLVTQSLDAIAFGSVDMGGGQPISLIASLGLLLPAIGVAVRRLHDIGKSGWWLLLALIPIVGTLALLYFYVQPSDPAPNAFGPPDPLPKG